MAIKSKEVFSSFWRFQFTWLGSQLFLATAIWSLFFTTSWSFWPLWDLRKALVRYFQSSRRSQHFSTWMASLDFFKYFFIELRMWLPSIDIMKRRIIRFRGRLLVGVPGKRFISIIVKVLRKFSWNFHFSSWGKG